jgi:acetyl esterase/lipase
MRAVACLTDALPFLDPPGRRVEIPFGGSHLVGILRLPAPQPGEEPPPVMIMIPGLDSAKEELRSTEELFLERGIATFSMDGPGQGEAEYDLAIRADWEVPGGAIIDYLQNEPGIDPGRIGVWGSSGGGQLASLLGLTAPGAGFDHGQYLQHSSAVQAVVDMFGPADFTSFDDAAPFGRLIAQIWLGSSTALRRSASPITYVAPGAPPFLILQGTEDSSLRQSIRLAHRLHTAGVPATLIEVQGAGHTLATPGQRPSPDEITATVIDFLTTTLR